jgi:hypothetical protein
MARAAGKGGESVELEVTLDDERARHRPRQRLPDVPQGSGPDLSVLVFVGSRTMVEALVRQGRVEAPYAWHLVERVYLLRARSLAMIVSRYFGGLRAAKKLPAK